MIYHGFFRTFSAGKRHVYDAVNMIHDVIRASDSLPYTAKFMFVGLGSNKVNKSDVER